MKRLNFMFGSQQLTREQMKNVVGATGTGPCNAEVTCVLGDGGPDPIDPNGSGSTIITVTGFTACDWFDATTFCRQNLGDDSVMWGCICVD